MRAFYLLLSCWITIVHAKKEEIGDQVFADYEGIIDQTHVATSVTDWYYETPRKRGGHLKHRRSSKSTKSKKKERKSECSLKYGKGRLANHCKKRKKKKKSKSMKQEKGISSSSKGFTTPYPTISQPSATTPFPTLPSQPSTTPPPAMMETSVPVIVLPPVDIVPPPKKTSSPTAMPVTAPPTSAPVSSVPPPTAPPAPSPTAPPVPQPTTSPTAAPSTMIQVTPAPVVSPPVMTDAPVTTPPTKAPSIRPTNVPTGPPTTAPTVAPDSSPTLQPITVTDAPTMRPVTDNPTAQTPTDTPSMSPTRPQTVAPTITFDIRSTPFEIVYTVDGDIGVDSAEEFEAAQIATLEFLEAYFFEIFGERDGTDLESFAGEVIESDPNVPPSAIFVAEFFFAPTSTFIPTKVELDLLIEAAFIEEPYSSDFLTRMTGLGPDNVFSTTSNAQYILRDDLDVVDEEPRNGLKLNYTSYGEADLKITPFAIDYNIDGREPTVNETIQAVHLTLAFVDEYFRASIDSVFPGSYKFLVGSGRPSATDATKIGYLVGIHAEQDAVKSISQQDLNEEVERAFNAPAVDALLLVLNALPDRNPFSTTSSVAFQSVPSLVDPENEQQFSTMMISMIVVGGCIFTVALLCLLDVRAKKSLRRKLIGPDIVIAIDGQNQYEIVSDCSAPSGERRLPHVPEEIYKFDSGEQSWAKNYDDEETIEFDLTKEFIKREKIDPLASPS